MFGTKGDPAWQAVGSSPAGVQAAEAHFKMEYCVWELGLCEADTLSKQRWGYKVGCFPFLNTLQWPAAAR